MRSFPDTGHLLSIAWSDIAAGGMRAPAVVNVRVGPMTLKGNVAAMARSAAQRGEWARRLLADTRPILERLAARGVSPRAVLDVIAACDRSSKPLQIGNAKQRAADAAALDHAAAIVSRWRPALERHTPWVRFEYFDGRGGAAYAYPSAKALRWIAEALRGMESERGAPAARHVLLCARVLELLVGRTADVGALIHAAWPAWPGGFADRDRGASGVDDEDAAKKLIARARQAVTESAARALLERSTVPKTVPATTSRQPKSGQRKTPTKKNPPR